ncbi:hypothetical protein PHYBLDRAFT_78888 [Phycomyces blakesleeanus NRRL 1555(-)]|uniref:FYVE-type domain-containing protein n=1 Tax=Phycomyces blakesleeanus (strain ATCC 8743b / DSM 1359 / FGSC 10004 / NBRC 33097 / NRRL 1555) TaxID=763407 RepID=A0A167N4W9_PHYB8|nr:hypothetical protein PHYBLDRAFT_78888 [Phycomyces blakesleeanus NRRL 1555(-)]OAD75000.1 hypothetical protein PHYBLDRAFT_78888 [Phycomyces blakesleeanus NRRL 1555(-)]|eukprot:XP_018293040.1 hypothetical protein PHYBLDRAFT_78888 [Phycomyces blakesleeanus NRRL 1555(-)]
MHPDHDTFLLPRPEWVNDEDVLHCQSCNSAFGHMKRRHHCRNCGNIFCNACSTRKVTLPQLGYGTKPARVCNSCFDVAYLVTYAIDEDHGVTTQVHGVRGLLELIENDHENDLHNIVAHGGIDALIWLCKSTSSRELHHLTTTILAILAEKESIRPVIITKCALPPLLDLIKYYTDLDKQGFQPPKRSSVSISSISPSDNSLTTPTPSTDTTIYETPDAQQNKNMEIIISCVHVLYQVARAGILSLKEVVGDGVFNCLMSLSAFEANQTIFEDRGSLAQEADADAGADRNPNPNPNAPANENTNTNTNEKASSISSESHSQINDRAFLIQSLAIKSIAYLCGFPVNQPSIIEQVQGTDKLACLLRSPHDDVQRYMAKSVAYLSLRNDKYKISLLGNGGADALVSIIARLPSEDSLEVEPKEETAGNILPSHSTVSHVCCALANFATNQESQVKLMQQPNILKYICNVPTAFQANVEIHRHVARCLANFSLYEDNHVLMLSDDQEKGHNVIPTLLALSQAPQVTSDVQRHIVRAIDNLSSNETVDHSIMSKFFEDVYLFIMDMLEFNKDKDTLKRAESIKKRVEEEKNKIKPKPKSKSKKSKRRQKGSAAKGRSALHTSDDNKEEGEEEDRHNNDEKKDEKYDDEDEDENENEDDED